jgi:hypothetical protein
VGSVRIQGCIFRNNVARIVKSTEEQGWGGGMLASVYNITVLLFLNGKCGRKERWGEEREWKEGR